MIQTIWHVEGMNKQQNDIQTIMGSDWVATNKHVSLNNLLVKMQDNGLKIIFVQAIDGSRTLITYNDGK